MAENSTRTTPRRTPAPKKSKKDDPPVFKRYGTIKTTAIGSANLPTEFLSHHLGTKPGDMIVFSVGEDKESLVIRKFDISKPPVSDKLTATHKKYLEGEDTYTEEEWKEFKKNHNLK